MKLYNDTKKQIQDAIERIKISNLNAGKYLEDNIIFNDQEMSFKYIGEPDVLAINFFK